jgi:hypothetical protein
MPTIESPGSGAKSGPLATKPARDLLVANINEIHAKIREMARVKPPVPFAVRYQVVNQRDELLNQYYAQLPPAVFGRCPFCNALLEQVFDPWGLDGFWWQETLTGKCPKPSACEHFRVLTGALNLNGQPPLGGEAESYPGPEVPYVIPKVLELPTMVAVVASLAMTNGYTAYPISYFSYDQPPTPALAHPWRMTSCNYKGPTGAPAFSYKTDPWDFDLSTWVAKGKVKWIEPGDRQNILKSAPADKCPYVDLKGLLLQQVIKNDQRFTKPPPHNEVYNPFSE